MLKPYSIYGASGAIGNYLHKLYEDLTIPIERNEVYPESRKVIYLISSTSNRTDGDHLQENINTNLTILLDRLESCREKGIDEFNFISSWFVYGEPSFTTATCCNYNMHVPYFMEGDHCNPKGFYSITKRTAEQIIIEYCNMHNIKWRIMRLANIYGNDSKASQIGRASCRERV